MKLDYKVAEDVAIAEIKEFVEYFKGVEQDETEIKTNFLYTIRALRLGLLTFDEKKTPTLILEDAIKTETGVIAVSEITFKTRLTTSEYQRILNSTDGKKNDIGLYFRTRAFLIGQPVAMLDKFSRFDEKAIVEISTLFLA